MPAWTQDELLLFLLFFVPGFVSIKIYDLLVPTERRDFQSTLAEAIGYSAVNFAVLLPLVVAVAYGYGALDGLWWQILTSYVVLLIAPVIWPWLFVRIIQPRFSKVFVNPIPKPWDVVFRQRGESWIIGLLAGRKHLRIRPKSSYTSRRFGDLTRTVDSLSEWTARAASSYPAER